jgi:uncharacterized protein (TIGR04551 family)
VTRHLRSLLACLCSLGSVTVGVAVLGVCIPAGTVQAQPATPEEEEEVEEEEEEVEEPRLRAPSAEELDWREEEAEEEAGDEEETSDEEEAEEADEEEEEAIEEAEEEELPDPERVEERLDGAGSDPTIAPWTTPETIFELHGYMRMRGEFQDQFSLGRLDVAGSEDEPFLRFIPSEDGTVPMGGCAGAGGSPTAACNQRALAYANMRLRLEPTIHLSDDVRVRMQLDIFDNLVMGSTPDGYGSYGAGLNEDGLLVDSYVPLAAFSQTQTPPSAGITSLTDSIVARRAWAEVRNRGLGEIRFGRMGNHWGLGLLANDGRGIDQDFQSDVDRIMILTRLFGIYLFGAWDFAAEGHIAYPGAGDRTGLSYDRGRNDDVDQFTFGVARRLTPEETTLTLERGDVVLNGGIYFVYRTQNLSTEYTNTLGNANDAAPPVYVRRGFESFTPDLWGQLLWDENGSATPDLRLEFEAVMNIGTIGNTAVDIFDAGSRRDILSFGLAFEGEYHLLNDQLGIYFNAGFASGDADAEGLTLNSAYRQRDTSSGAPDRTISTMAFHPAYRVDLIFWRNIMRSVAGAYYFRPGLSYDFIRNSFGQLLGARADVIWSRAAEPIQTWGNQADLGVEIDAQVYYRSEDGPDLLDGFYASLQYGIFFPLAGVGYLPGTGTTGTGGQNAQTLRLILGVSY